MKGGKQGYVREIYSFSMAAVTTYHKPRSLKTIKIYSFTVLEVRNLKSRLGQGWFLLEALREKHLFRASLLASAGIPRLAGTSLQFLPSSSHHLFLSVSLCLLFVKLHLPLNLGSMLNLGQSLLEILNLITSAQNLFSR